MSRVISATGLLEDSSMAAALNEQVGENERITLITMSREGALAVVERVESAEVTVDQILPLIVAPVRYADDCYALLPEGDYGHRAVKEIYKDTILGNPIPFWVIALKGVDHYGQGKED